MASDKTPDLQASILDRLIDHQPEVSREPVQRRLAGFSEVRAAVVRDLENLLNTRSQFLPVPGGCKEVSSSLFVYGLRDYTSQNPKSPSVKNQLRQEVEQAIKQFEPRLKNATVTVGGPSEEDRTVRLRISALLVVEPLTEPVTFDTYFDVNRGEYRILR